MLVLAMVVIRHLSGSCETAVRQSLELSSLVDWETFLSCFGECDLYRICDLYFIYSFHNIVYWVWKHWIPRSYSVRYVIVCIFQKVKFLLKIIVNSFILFRHKGQDLANNKEIQSRVPFMRDRKKVRRILRHALDNVGLIFKICTLRIGAI